VVNVLLLFACHEPPPAAPPAEAALARLSPTDQLTRASLDLRGVRPAIAEIERVEADPLALETLIDEYMVDPRFGARVADLFSEVFLTRTESYLVSFEGYGVEDISQASLLRSIGDEPLQMIAHVASNDRPLTDLVTADYTMGNEVLARLWPIDYPEGGTGWQEVHYIDGRPAAGLLASNSLWWRYQSTDSNANRGRANAVSRLFLCHDYLTRPIEFDRNVNLLDEEAINDALRTNPGCVNCHASLDPLAAYFFGFTYYEFTGGELSEYHPERERNWTQFLGTPPAYYGEPGDDLSDLGRQIASDHRFPECVVQHTTQLLLRRDVTAEDMDSLTRHREALLQGEMKLRPLLKSVLLSDEYRAAADDTPRGVPLKLVTPNLLLSQVHDLTGFDWQTVDGWSLLESDAMGFLTLAGGADGTYVVKNATSPNSTLLLVQERLAEAASDFVVASDAADRANARLFTEIDFTETPETGRDAMVAQIQRLHLLLFGDRVAADGPEVEANLSLWSELHEVEPDPARAWTGLLSALLRDPSFLLY
jgi:hypothetical protein